MAEGELPRQVAGWAWQNRDWIRKKLSGVYDWFRANRSDDSRKLLIIGPGGAGKTTMARILCGDYDWLLDTDQLYEESIGVESYNLDDENDTEIIVPPGQHHRRGATWDDVHSELTAGKISGIILAGSYGYCNLGDFNYKEHRLYRGGKKKFLMEYLSENRRDEIRILEKLAPCIMACPEKVWLLTVVAKQDLWWQNREDVEFHYREGDYGDPLRQLEQECERHQFRAETVYCSLSIRNFGSNRGDVLKKNCAGYGHPEQAYSLRRLFEVVDALRNWEAES